MARRPLKTIQYFCNGFCTASVRRKHAKRNDIVVLIADGTSVTINFLTSSPFVSGVNPINMAANTARLEIVSSTATFGDHQYTLTCGSCPSVINNPVVIVDP